MKAAASAFKDMSVPDLERLLLERLQAVADVRAALDWRQSEKA